MTCLDKGKMGVGVKFINKRNTKYYFYGDDELV